MKLSSAGTFFSPTLVPQISPFLQIYPQIVNPCFVLYDVTLKQFIKQVKDPPSIFPFYMNTIVIDNLNTVRLQQPIPISNQTSCYQDFFFIIKNYGKWFGEPISLSAADGVHHRPGLGLKPL